MWNRLDTYMSVNWIRFGARWGFHREHSLEPFLWTGLDAGEEARRINEGAMRSRARVVLKWYEYPAENGIGMLIPLTELSDNRNIAHRLVLVKKPIFREGTLVIKTCTE